MDGTITLLWRVLAIFAVLALVGYVGLRWGVRQFDRGSSGMMQVIDRLALAPNRSLLLVRVADRILLLGVTDGQITLLKELPTASHVDRQTMLTGLQHDDLFTGTQRQTRFAPDTTERDERQVG